MKKPKEQFYGPENLCDIVARQMDAQIDENLRRTEEDRKKMIAETLQKVWAVYKLTKEGRKANANGPDRSAPKSAMPADGLGKVINGNDFEEWIKKSLTDLNKEMVCRAAWERYRTFILAAKMTPLSFPDFVRSGSTSTMRRFLCLEEKGIVAGVNVEFTGPKPDAIEGGPVFKVMSVTSLMKITLKGERHTVYPDILEVVVK